MKIIDNFKIGKEKESFQQVNDRIEHAIPFRGTNLWILIFAIFIASLGLNVNSTAVIIGAMLVSPLMGPIMGLGFGMAVNDLAMLRKSFSSYLFAGGIGLATSTLYFLLSPISDAHTEIFARTAPNIYDVLIALFGGLAGMLASASKLKGNVIPGVAIATALMPPLCTAGYGLAALKAEYFFGALYLFFINSVFIGLATVITVRLLKYPFKHLPERHEELKAQRIMYAIAIVTVLPSLYFGYDLVQQNNFTKRANQFIDKEASFPNDYLLQRNINAKEKLITLTYGGDIISQAAIDSLSMKLGYYQLEKTTLKIQQGFAYLQRNNKESKENTQLTQAVAEKELRIQHLQAEMDSMTRQREMSRQVFAELKAQYPDVKSFVLQTAFLNSDSGDSMIWVCSISSEKNLKEPDKHKIEEWLKVRINAAGIQMNYN